jgi:hypothetical protein
MLKSFPIIKIIKKNWKVIVLLVALLIIALLVLALYPKIQEGVTTSQPNTGQIGATNTTATVTLPSTLSGNLKVSKAGPNPITDLTGSGTVTSYTIGNLKPNTKYTGITVSDNTTPKANASTFSNGIFTLPDATCIPTPSFSAGATDASGNHSKIHTEYDATGKIFAFFKFDGGVDMTYDNRGTALQGSVTSYTIIDKATNTPYVADVNTDGKNPLYQTSNPNTGNKGWCRLSGLKPGTAYNFSIVANCSMATVSTALSAYPTLQTSLASVGDISGAMSAPISIITCPVCPTITTTSSSPDAATAGTSTLIINFTSPNGPNTMYRTNLLCQSNPIPGYTETLTAPGTLTCKGVPTKLISSSGFTITLIAIINSSGNNPNNTCDRGFDLQSATPKTNPPNKVPVPFTKA